ncbi:MAG: thiamine phosphate synthase [Alphaproteobacteria bacterium]|nr:thiamine phosphate synthase [Alphaproteobacteria bacterium]
MSTPSPHGECRLYLITPDRFDPTAFRDVLAAALDAGDVAAVQLRLKSADDDEFMRACDILRPIAQERDVAFILNDRVDLVTAAGCDGAHVGADDMTYGEARRLVGTDAILGVSCYASPHLAMVAAEAGADYVAFGAFYATRTKEARGHPTPQILEDWHAVMTVPAVAIGGIKVDNCRVLARAGADFVAVVTGVWDYAEGAAAAVRDFNREIERAFER